MSSTPTDGYRPRHLSHSSIDKFVRCPYNWYLSYVKKSPFAATRPMLIGSLFGKGIEDIHNGLGVDAESMTKHFMALKEGERANLDPVADLDIVMRLIDLYRTREGGPYRGTPEYRAKVYLPDRKAVPVPLLCFMDLRVDDEPVVKEFKTGRWATHPEYGYTKQKVRSMAQCKIYWYADKMLNGRDSRIDVVALSYGDHGVAMIEESTQPTMDDIEEIQEEAAKLWQAILAEDFPCICGKCQVESA